MGPTLSRVTKITEWVFPAVPPSYDSSHPLLVKMPVEAAGTEAPALLIGKEFLSDSDLPNLGKMVSTCVIYFHSNGSDVGLCVDEANTLRDGILDGDAVVLCPEYPGYGLLRAYEPSVNGINLVGEAAWLYCTETLGFLPGQMMICGRSIGTGPATQLAHRLGCNLKSSSEGCRGTLPSMPVSATSSPGHFVSSSPVPQPVDQKECSKLGEESEADAGAGPQSRLSLGDEMYPGITRQGSIGPSSVPPSAVARGSSFGPGRGAGSPTNSETYVASRYSSAESTTLGSIWGAERPEVGNIVTVLEDFHSDSVGRVALRRGERGVVIRVDSCGDTLVDFKAYDRSQWLFKSNHDKVLFTEPVRPVGALILIAPLMSVAAVVQHHIPSEVAASLVGPMWNVLEMVQSDVMEDIPLFILHPKSDEIVPSKHGQTVFERATCRQKFGVWLCNATHNICLEEDHLRIARRYFKNLHLRRMKALGLAHCSGSSNTFPGSRSVMGEDWDGSDLEDEIMDKQLSLSAGEASLEVEIMAVADRLLQLGVAGEAEHIMEMSL